MSLGGFESFVKITRAQLHGGFTETGRPTVAGEIELEGELIEFSYTGLTGLMSRRRERTKQLASVEIEFVEKREDSFDASNLDPTYIGTLHTDLIEDSESGHVRRALARIALPLNMFSQLMSMQGRHISFQTIHDIIEKRTKEQEMDHIVAFVKRVYFETKSESPLPEDKKE